MSTPTEPTEPKIVAQQMTAFLSDPSEVLNAATAEPDWDASPRDALARVLLRKGFCPEARAYILDGLEHMDAMATYLLSTLSNS